MSPAASARSPRAHASTASAVVRREHVVDLEEVDAPAGELRDLAVEVRLRGRGGRGRARSCRGSRRRPTSVSAASRAVQAVPSTGRSCSTRDPRDAAHHVHARTAGRARAPASASGPKPRPPAADGNRFSARAAGGRTRRARAARRRCSRARGPSGRTSRCRRRPCPSRAAAAARPAPGVREDLVLGHGGAVAVPAVPAHGRRPTRGSDIVSPFAVGRFYIVVDASCTARSERRQPAVTAFVA